MQKVFDHPFPKTIHYVEKVIQKQMGRDKLK